MPVKAALKLGSFADIEAAQGFQEYTGPCPPSGLYQFVVKFMKLIKNGSGDPMFKLLFEVSEPKNSPKAQYNGAVCWHNANVTLAGAPYMNAMFDALGIDRRGDIFMSDDKPDRVVRIGKKKVDGLRVLINVKKEPKFGTDPEDKEFALNAKAFASLTPESVDDDGDRDEAVEDDENLVQSTAEEAEEDGGIEDDGDAF